jgi:C1A family cysteine protease
MNRPLGWSPPERYGRAPHKGYTMRSGRQLDGFAKHVRLHIPQTVYDQGAVGSCVAQSLAFAIEILSERQSLPQDRPDRTALYRRVRQAIGTVGEDSGGIIADGIEALRKGWETETREPSDVFDATYTMPPLPLSETAPRLINAEPVAHDLTTVVWEILCGHPVVVGIRITNQWNRPEEVIPAPEGDVRGGHAVCLVGYQRDDNGLQFRVRNSWGPAWGNGGEVWIDSAWLGIEQCGELHALRVVRRA